MEDEIKKLENKREKEILEINKKYDKLIKKEQKKIIEKLKKEIWNTYVGENKSLSDCYCCTNIIKQKQFEFCYFKTDSKEIQNLRPVCIECKKKIGNTKLIIYTNIKNKDKNLFVFEKIIDPWINLLKKI